MKNKVFKFYSDPGHGWLAVKRKLLKDLGILDKVTWHSYERGKTVYLEEDVDVGLFFKAWEAKYGTLPKNREQRYYEYSAPIRSYDHFRLTDDELEVFEEQARKELY
jgi:hypothetical protein